MNTEETGSEKSFSTEENFIFLSLVDSTIYHNWNTEVKRKHYTNTLLTVSKRDSKQRSAFTLSFVLNYSETKNILQAYNRI